MSENFKRMKEIAKNGPPPKAKEKPKPKAKKAPAKDPNPERDARMYKFRLPPASKFELTWDGKIWTGCLYVGVDLHRKYEMAATGIHELVDKLGQEWFKSQEKK